MDSSVSESSGQMVLLPIVVPVSVPVGAKSEHADLKQKRQSQWKVKSSIVALSYRKKTCNYDTMTWNYIKGSVFWLLLCLTSQSQRHQNIGNAFPDR